VIQFVISGISMGAIYALVAISINMIYNITGGLNFAQGEFFMLGALLSYFFYHSLSLPLWFGGILSFSLVGLFAATIFDKIAYQPVKNRSSEIMIISTLCVGIMIREIIKANLGAIPKSHPAHWKGITKIGNVIFVNQYILIVVATLFIIMILIFVLNKTRMGIILRAVAQNPDVASLLGVDAEKMIAIGFFITAMIAAMAGVLVAPTFFITPDMGFMNMIKGFCVAVVGGFGNLKGALLSGFIIGLVEVFAAVYISTVYKNAYAFAVLVLILWIKPSGIFGEIISEKV